MWPPSNGGRARTCFEQLAAHLIARSGPAGSVAFVWVGALGTEREFPYFDHELRHAGIAEFNRLLFALVQDVSPYYAGRSTCWRSRPARIRFLWSVSKLRLSRRRLLPSPAAVAFRSCCCRIAASSCPTSPSTRWPKPWTTCSRTPTGDAGWAGACCGRGRPPLHDRGSSPEDLRRDRGASRLELHSLATMTQPTFLVIGAMKAGTTALWRYLREHSEVFMPDPKEVHFFSRKWDEGWDWYEAKFADTDGALAVGEASPSYSEFCVLPRGAGAHRVRGCRRYGSSISCVTLSNASSHIISTISLSATKIARSKSQCADRPEYLDVNRYATRHRGVSRTHRTRTVARTAGRRTASQPSRHADADLRIPRRQPGRTRAPSLHLEHQRADQKPRRAATQGSLVACGAARLRRAESSLHSRLSPSWLRAALPEPRGAPPPTSATRSSKRRAQRSVDFERTSARPSTDGARRDPALERDQENRRPRLPTPSVEMAPPDARRGYQPDAGRHGPLAAVGIRSSRCLPDTPEGWVIGPPDFVGVGMDPTPAPPGGATICSVHPDVSRARGACRRNGSTSTDFQDASFGDADVAAYHRYFPRVPWHPRR